MELLKERKEVCACKTPVCIFVMARETMLGIESRLSLSGAQAIFKGRMVPRR